MTKSKKKHESSRDGITQTPWLCATLDRLLAQSPNASQFGFLSSSHSLKYHSRAQFAGMVSKIACALSEMDVRPGQRIAIDASMSHETCACWIAALTIGAVPVFYPVDMRFRDKRAALEQDVGEQQSPLVIVTEDPEQAKLWLEASGLPTPHIIYIHKKTPSGKTIKDIYDQDASEKLVLFSELSTGSTEPMVPYRVSEDDPAAYVYTQGSHAQSARRIAISHNHLRAQAEDLQTKLSITQDSHLYIDLYSPHAVSLIIAATAILSGASLLIQPPHLPADMIYTKAGKITHCFLLPHTIQGIIDRIKSEHGEHWNQLVIRLAKFRNRNTHKWFKWPGAAIDKFLINPIKDKYFPSLSAVVSYGNHFDAKAADLLTWLNIPVYNAFTIGELGFVHLHRFNGQGGFLKSIEARIKSGILSVKSSRLSTPYIQTGDFVFEDDRCGLCAHRSSLVALSNDDSVDASPMRDILKRNDLIEEIYIYGENRPFLTALIYINETALLKWASDNHIDNYSFESLTQNEQFYTYIRNIVDNCNNTRAARESIQKIAILNRSLSKDPHILSPCGLTRFKEIERRYQAMLESFYQSDF